MRKTSFGFKIWITNRKDLRKLPQKDDSDQWNVKEKLIYMNTHVTYPYRHTFYTFNVRWLWQIIWCVNLTRPSYPVFSHPPVSMLLSWYFFQMLLTFKSVAFEWSSLPSIIWVAYFQSTEGWGLHARRISASRLSSDSSSNINPSLSLQSYRFWSCQSPQWFV